MDLVVFRGYLFEISFFSGLSVGGPGPLGWGPLFFLGAGFVGGCNGWSSGIVLLMVLL